MTTPWLNGASARFLVAAVIGPVGLQVVFFATAARYHSAVPWYGNFLSQGIGIAVGLLILAMQFKWRTLLIAVVYVPAIFALLVYETLVLGASVHDFL